MAKAALIDADILLYKFGFTNEETYQWDENTESKSHNFQGAINGIQRFVKRLRRNVEVGELVMCFSSSPNFRYDIMPTYKENRRDKDKPDMIHAIRDWIENNYPSKSKPRLEADDVMGILATLEDKYIVCSIDKDMKQIPAKLYNWDYNQFKTISEEAADRYFFKQVLMGDSSDGYSGVPYVGDKRSEKILDNKKKFETYWDIVLDTYKDKGLTKKDALKQARVARILRAEDWDFKNNKPILWTPPTRNVCFSEGQYEVFRDAEDSSTSWVVNNKSEDGKHAHFSDYDEAIKMVKEAVKNRVPRDFNRNKLKRFARFVNDGLAKEAIEIAEVREDKGPQSDYHNKTGAQGV